MRGSIRRASVIFVVASALLAPSTAQADPGVDGSLLYSGAMTLRMMIDEATGNTTAVAEGTRSVLSPTGEVLSSVEVPVPPVNAATSGGAFCEASGAGTSENFRALSKTRLYRDDVVATINWTYFPYLKSDARSVNGERTKQLEVCASGGSRTYEGWRLQDASTTVTYQHPLPYQIGGAHATTARQPNLEVPISLRVPPTSPVTITGKLSIARNGYNHGNPGRGPYATPDDAFPLNEYYAGWEAKCTGLQQFSRFCGSEDFQGSVGHDLWEFPMTQPVDQPFSMTAYYVMKCGRILGVGCPSIQDPGL